MTGYLVEVTGAWSPCDARHRTFCQDDWGHSLVFFSIEFAKKTSVGVDLFLGGPKFKLATTPGLIRLRIHLFWQLESTTVVCLSRKRDAWTRATKEIQETTGWVSDKEKRLSPSSNFTRWNRNITISPTHLANSIYQQSAAHYTLTLWAKKYGISLPKTLLEFSDVFLL